MAVSPRRAPLLARVASGRRYGGGAASAAGQHQAPMGDAVVPVVNKIGSAPQTLHDWVEKAEVDSGKRAGVTSDTADKLKVLAREVRELREANEFLHEHQHISRRRSLTARSSDDRVYR